MSGLPAGSPATTAGPLSPPFSRLGREVRRSPPLGRFVSPWHGQHLTRRGEPLLEELVVGARGPRLSGTAAELARQPAPKSRESQCSERHVVAVLGSYSTPLSSTSRRERSIAKAIASTPKSIGLVDLTAVHEDNAGAIACDDPIIKAKMDPEHYVPPAGWSMTMRNVPSAAIRPTWLRNQYHRRAYPGRR